MKSPYIQWGGFGVKFFCSSSADTVSVAICAVQHLKCGECDGGTEISILFTFN